MLTRVTAMGVAMPVMIYGTAWKKERSATLVYTALREGFRGVDTANQPKHYNEEGVGEGIARAIADGICTRADLFVQTKFTSVDGQDPRNIPYDPRASLEDQVKTSLEVSLQHIPGGYIDSWVLHGPLRTFSDTMRVYRQMEEGVKAKKVRQLGLSNIYDVALLKQIFDAAEVKPAVLQNRFHAETGYDREIRKFCREKHIMYQSFWTLTANPHFLKTRPVAAIIDRLAHSGITTTPAMVMFAWLIQCGVTPLSGTCTPAHMQDDVNVAKGAVRVTAEEANVLCSIIGDTDMATAYQE